MNPSRSHPIRHALLSTAALSFVLLLGAGLASAQTVDGLTPAEETVCSGLGGRAFGLCNAYCEAMDCDVAGDGTKACEALRDNYFLLTGASAFPCDVTCPALPDPTCSGSGTIGSDAEGCDVCLCPPGWGGSDCATCEAGFDECGECGGFNDCWE